MTYNQKYDFILKVPIKKLEFSFNNHKKLLTLKLQYFENYNCYNLDDKKERDIILLKNYK
jgi:hypothetical protein